VVLCEKTDRLGGALSHCDGIPFKESLRKYRENQIDKLKRLPIEIRLNTPVYKSTVREISPEVIVAAVGAKPIKLSIPGAAAPNVYDVTDKIRLKEKGDTVIIGGGLVGCEYAVFLAMKGHRVTILEMREELAPDAGFMHRTNILHQIEAHESIVSVTNMRCVEITDRAVIAESPEGRRDSYIGEHVIIAVGRSPLKEVVEALRFLAPVFYTIGDALKPANIMQAVKDGYDTAVDIGIY
jgi:NADPH-dependent 2,4-dienoyl-CoA reductase/sulfur reductase-like enzyme